MSGTSLQVLSFHAIVFSGATLCVDAGGSLHAPQLWEVPDHQQIPEYSWDPYQNDR